MKNKILFSLIIGVFASVTIFGQETELTEKSDNSRVVVTDATKNLPTPVPTPKKLPVYNNSPLIEAAPRPTRSPQTLPTDRKEIISPVNIDVIPAGTSLKYGELKSKIEEAKRNMRTTPLRIAMTDTEQTHEIVRIAFYDSIKDQIDYAVIRKIDFLDKNSEILARSENGQTIRIRTIRGNGVNTPIIIFNNFNQSMLPLVVQYPIEKFGKFREMSYYISTHPGLVTPGTVSAGRLYVRNVLDTARAKLREKGIFIQPKVMDIAEHLALVEHVDHQRFFTEYHPKIYNDVYTLYALNQGQTYRYSVSSAGAGGMVQMIPPTYRMIRSRYYSVGLMPDFVEGMRNHVNASQAMLLYMQMTWNDLIAEDAVFNAMQSGIATQEQLMAAGYNSNPVKLKLYLRRGGENWTDLIPKETKVYLRIYESIEKHVQMKPRTQ